MATTKSSYCFDNVIHDEIDAFFKTHIKHEICKHNMSSFFLEKTFTKSKK
jgi:hypothetical protein